MVLRFASLSVFIYCIFSGKNREPKTQDFPGMMVQPVCSRLVDSVGKNTERYHQEFLGELRLGNTHCNKFRDATEQLISMSTQIIHLISSRDYQVAFQKEYVIFYKMKQHLKRPRPSITTHTLSESGYKEILTYQKIYHYQKSRIKKKQYGVTQRTV